jgi:hypothetical protein
MIASALSRHPDGSSIGARRRLSVSVDQSLPIESAVCPMLDSEVFAAGN